MGGRANGFWRKLVIWAGSSSLSSIVHRLVGGVKYSDKNSSVQREFVRNKAKGRISKRLLQKTKHVKLSEKTNISYPPDTYTYKCVPGLRNVCFSENLMFFVFLEHPF